MATGNVKRHDLEPSPRLVINAAAGGAYDLTNCSVKMIMKFGTTLSAALDDSEVTVDLPAAIVDQVELGDILLVDHERMIIGGSLPTQPIVGAAATFTMSRGDSKAATAGSIYGSSDVDGQLGVNQYRLSDDAVFTLSVDSGAPTTVTVTTASTTTNNSMADLVTDVNTALGVAGLAATATNQNDKLVITSDSTGAASNVAISAPDAIAIAELGIIAAYGTGEAAETTTAKAHIISSAVNVIKIDRSAIVDSPATNGTVSFEWITGDTEKLGTYFMEFEITTPSGKKFTAPANDTFSVEFVSDFDDS
ncbi:hypothetical protein LCGC14_1806710 [marine sediment metagenome]|uniref:Uncharacterized protein n=1 Tax=marine sediment metagenome TaxID=412755 RepID=A0A0F9J2L7_9ZZZZ